MTKLNKKNKVEQVKGNLTPKSLTEPYVNLSIHTALTNYHHNVSVNDYRLLFFLRESCHGNAHVQIGILSTNEHFCLAHDAIQLYRQAKKELRSTHIYGFA